MIGYVRRFSLAAFLLQLILSACSGAAGTIADAPSGFQTSSALSRSTEDVNVAASQPVELQQPTLQTASMIPPPIKYGYTGKRLDPESEQNDYEARSYASRQMHFTTPDSIVPNPMDPQSFNRYAYVRNNPMKYVDPTGHAETGISLITFFHAQSEWAPFDLDNANTVINVLQDAKDSGAIGNFNPIDVTKMSKDQFKIAINEASESSDKFIFKWHGKKDLSGVIFTDAMGPISNKEVGEIARVIGKSEIVDGGCFSACRATTWASNLSENGRAWVLRQLRGNITSETVARVEEMVFGKAHFRREVFAAEWKSVSSEAGFAPTGVMLGIAGGGLAAAGTFAAGLDIGADFNKGIHGDNEAWGTGSLKLSGLAVSLAVPPVGLAIGLGALELSTPPPPPGVQQRGPSPY